MTGLLLFGGITLAVLSAAWLLALVARSSRLLELVLGLAVIAAGAFLLSWVFYMVAGGVTGRLVAGTVVWPAITWSYIALGALWVGATRPLPRIVRLVPFIIVGGVVLLGVRVRPENAVTGSAMLAAGLLYALGARTGSERGGEADVSALPGGRADIEERRSKVDHCPVCGSGVFFLINAMVSPREYRCLRCERVFTSDGREVSQAMAGDFPPIPPFFDEKQRRDHKNEYWRGLNAWARDYKPEAKYVEMVRSHERAVRARRYRWARTVIAEIKRFVRREPRVFTTPYEPGDERHTKGGPD